MKNLAGVIECDQTIKEELGAAGVPMFTKGWRSDEHRPEVPWTVFGMLEGFVFTRAWYYWVVSGRMPLAMAEAIYANETVRCDVRAGGHCNRIEPETVCEWFDKYGNRLIALRELEVFERLWKNGSLPEPEGNFGRFVEDPKAHYGFVTTYHVDSQMGLNFLVGAIKGMHTIESFNKRRNSLQDQP